MIAIPAHDDMALVSYLAERDVVVSCRDGNVRAGFLAYNNEDEVDRFIALLIGSGLCRSTATATAA